jgi:hypothetical protein
MYLDADFYLDEPHWNGNREQRLYLSLALATVLICALLAMLELPLAGTRNVIGEIAVRILLPEPPPDVQQLDTPEPVKVFPEVAATLPAPQSSDETQTEEVPAAPTDWLDLIETAAKEGPSLHAPPPSMTPAFDALRRAAVKRYAPSRAPQKKDIWDNVETDSLGRKILVSGECYRVIDDPNVGSMEAFQTFHQFLAFCNSGKRAGRELPWVAELRARYDYLQPPE